MPLSGSASAAVSKTEFTGFMRAAGPFPEGAAVAVAVSGGADSMTLLALASDWSAKIGARLTALTVDHGLRSESAAEAGQVAAWCAAHGAAHQTLAWTGDKPEKGLQAAARTARYALLEDWCRMYGHTELLVAHSQNDQAETFLMRMSRGSGIDGLAAMPLVSDRGGIRLIRPLLSVPRSRIEATVAALSLETVTDPSNLDRRYARVRMRDKLKLLEAHGVSVAAIAGTARVFGNMRAARERDIAKLAVEIAVLHPEGYVGIDRAGLSAARPEVSRGLVAALLTAVGGLDYPPRRERLDRLMTGLFENVDFRPRTLGNCVISTRGEDFMFRREYRTIRDVVAVNAGGHVLWDGRFNVEFSHTASIDRAEHSLGALGEDGWRYLVGVSDREKIAAYRGIPGPVRYALPAIWRKEKIVEVPHLLYKSDQGIENIVKNVEFRMQPALLGQPFWVV